MSFGVTTRLGLIDAFWPVDPVAKDCAPTGTLDVGIFRLPIAFAEVNRLPPIRERLVRAVPQSV